MARTKNFDQNEVLQRALELFWSKGYNATSIQDLVDHLGVNRASLYGTWGDKHSLYLETLQLYRKGASTWLLELVRSERPAKQIVEEFLNYAIAESEIEQTNNGCYLVNSATELANTDKEVSALVNDNKETVVKVLTAIIEEGKEEGEITSLRSSEDLATYIFSIVSGLRVMRQTGMSTKELRKTAEIALSTLD